MLPSDAALYGLLVWDVLLGMSIADLAMLLAAAAALAALLRGLMEGGVRLQMDVRYVHDKRPPWHSAHDDAGNCGGRE